MEGITPLTARGETSKGDTLVFHLKESYDRLTGLKFVQVEAVNRRYGKRYVYEMDYAMGLSMYRRLATAVYMDNPRIVASALGPAWKWLRQQSESPHGNVRRLE